ncbi:hypothetical protein [Streptomyces mexicanus]|uniref:hypothetical protein n=1 Tax=Streptomyces mexicanus TaxID=178566 RepID=UPI0031EF9F62
MRRSRERDDRAGDPRLLRGGRARGVGTPFARASLPARTTSLATAEPSARYAARPVDAGHHAVGATVPAAGDTHAARRDDTDPR